MSRRSHLPALAVVLLIFGGIAGLRAQTVTYTWTGLSDSTYWNEPANWSGGVLPVEDLANSVLVFGNVAQTRVVYYQFFVNQVRLTGHTRPYDVLGGFDTLHLGSSGLVYDPAGSIETRWRDTVQLEAPQTWDIRNGVFALDGPITGAHQITKTGAGTLDLRSDASSLWTGGLVLSAGKLGLTSSLTYYILNSEVLGTGPLTFNGGTVIARKSGYDEGNNRLPVSIANPIVSNGLISTENEVPLYFTGAGTVTLAADTTITTQGHPFYLEGQIDESGGARRLTIDGDGAVMLRGSSNWTGGTQVNRGVLIFDGEDNTPGLADGITIGSLGYVGISLGQNVGNFLDQVAPTSTGMIGFDSNPDSSPDLFTTPIDLSGTNGSLRIGSATHAVLGVNVSTLSSATITPFGNTYRFGGGGGFLYVQTPISNDGATPRSVVLDSPAERPLLVKFEHSNNPTPYTGGTSITNSGLVFGSNSFPGGAASVTVNQGGYVGFEYWGDQTTQQLVDNTLPWINPASTGMIGFDNMGEFVATINLSGFTNPIYLGTATLLDLSQTITPQGTTYRFGAYKGGELNVASLLTGPGHNVLIGDPNSLATMGHLEFDEESPVVYSTVQLSGNNTYGGGTTLYAGQLNVGQSNGVPGTDPTTALGTGTLTVQPYNFTFPDGFEEIGARLSLTSGLILPNAIQLNADLYLGSNSASATLAGTISGPGELYLDRDDFELTLGGNNTFSGGIYLGSQNNDLILGTNTAAGTGPIAFGGGFSNDVFFDTAAPVIGGLEMNADSDFARLFARVADTILTINQSSDAAFFGEFRSEDPSESLRLVKSGPGTLYLQEGGLYVYNGPKGTSLAGDPEVTIQVNAGTLVLNNDFYIGETNTTNNLAVPPIAPTTIWVNGGTLAVDNDNHVYNPLVVTSGRLAGQGFFNSVSIGTGAIISPGLAALNPIGVLDFSDLTLAGGGLLEWNLIAADPTLPSGADRVSFEPGAGLSITATSTPGDQFTLKLISLQPDGTPGIVSGFSGDRSYTWTLFDATGVTLTGFNPAKFVIDTSQFFTDLPQSTFALSLSGDGQMIQLTFQPVPEPSTYALFALGLGLIVVTIRRRRQIP